MLIVTAIMGFAFFVEACFGFGGGLVAVPILSLIMPPKDAVFLMLVFQCLKSVLLIPAWKQINWRVMRILPIGILIGAPLGVAVLDIVPADGLRIFLGIYLVFFVLSDYLNVSVWSHLAVRLHGTGGALSAGFAGGVISGICGMGGPPLVAYLRTLQMDRHMFRASILAILTILNLFRFILDAHEIVRNASVLNYLLPCLVVFAIVMPLGAHLPKIMSETQFKRSIDLLLLASAAMLLYKGFSA